MKNARLSVLVGLGLALSVVSRAWTADSSKPIAKIGTTVLTEDQMRADLAMQLYQTENNLYMIQKNWVDQKAQDVLFNAAAKEAGLSRKDWEAKEIDAKTPPPDENQASQMAGQFAKPGVSSMDAMKSAKDYITNQNKMIRRNALYQELSKKTPVEMMLVKPTAPHIDVAFAADDPMKGNPKAPVTIIEFTDFQCPFCKRSQDSLHQIEEAYPKDVRIIARQYPLPFHDRAKPAAEAAMCAKEQGKFWEYRDKLFTKQELSDADLSRYAKELTLNEKKFSQCLSTHKYATRIETDLADGKRYGVNGTPHFFINGVSVVGAQPYPVFQQAIQDALAQKK